MSSRAWRSIRQLSAILEDETVGDCNRRESVLYPHGYGHRAIRLPPLNEPVFTETMGLQNPKRWFDSILVRQFLESRLMAGHRPLKSADVGSTPTFPTILFTGGLLVSQSRFEREPRRSDSYSVIRCKEVPPSLSGRVHSPFHARA